MLAQEIHGFEVQHFQFATQVARQEEVLKSLPSGEWPAGILYLRGRNRDQIVAEAKTKADMDLGQQYSSRDFIQHNQHVAVLERGRVEGYHVKALLGLPVGARRDAAMLAAKNKRKKEENVRLGITNV